MGKCVGLAGVQWGHGRSLISGTRGLAAGDDHDGDFDDGDDHDGDGHDYGDDHDGPVLHQGHLGSSSRPVDWADFGKLFILETEGVNLLGNADLLGLKGRAQS